MNRQIITLLALLLPIGALAQIGQHRNTFSVGVNGGYNLTTVRFTPKVVQSMKGGVTGGIAMRYTVEKYFSTIASIAGCYECIEPQVSNVFKRETLSGEFLQVNPYLVAELKRHGHWTPEIRTRLKRD